MATLIKNASQDETPECIGSAENMAIVNNRISDPNFDVSTIRTQVYDLHDTISASANTKIREIKKATTFPIKDILQMMIDHECCKFVRVYEGFDSSGRFVTYLVALDENLKTYNNPTASQSCCHCKPCLTDKILNP
jgi:hypothetical protein